MCAWRAKTVKREDEAIGATSAIRQQSLFLTIVASSTQFHRLYCFYLDRVPQIQPQLYIIYMHDECYNSRTIFCDV